MTRNIETGIVLQIIPRSKDYIQKNWIKNVHHYEILAFNYRVFNNLNQVAFHNLRLFFSLSVCSGCGVSLRHTELHISDNSNVYITNIPHKMYPKKIYNQHLHLGPKDYSEIVNISNI